MRLIYFFLFSLLFFLGGTSCDIGKDEPYPNFHGITLHIQIADTAGHDLIDSLRTIGRETTQAEFHVVLEKEGRIEENRTFQQVSLEEGETGYISVSQDINSGEVEAGLRGRVLFDFSIPALLGPNRQVSVSVNWGVEDTESYQKEIYFTDIMVDGKLFQTEATETLVLPLTSEGLHLELP